MLSFATNSDYKYLACTTIRLWSEKSTNILKKYLLLQLLFSLQRSILPYFEKVFIAIVFILSAVTNLPTSWKVWIHSAFIFSLFGLPSPMLNCPRDVAWTLTLRIYRHSQNQLNVPFITQDQTRGGSTILHLIFILFSESFHATRHVILNSISSFIQFHISLYCIITLWKSTV